VVQCTCAIFLYRIFELDVDTVCIDDEVTIAELTAYDASFLDPWFIL
jgi:hypothetical protein